jgi:polyisoprenoid-binding protein YceI
MKVSAIILGSALVLGMAWLATDWKVDSEKAKVGFSVKGPFGTVNGTFTGLEAAIHFDPSDPGGSSVQASIDANTVSSGVGLRNHHLKTEEQYLNTAKYPRISYKSTKIEKSGSGFKALGNLTIKDVTKPVEIPFTFVPDGGNGVFKGDFSFKREDFTIGKSGGSVGDMITIHLEIPVKK